MSSLHKPCLIIKHVFIAIIWLNKDLVHIQDEILIEETTFEEFWQRDVEELIRQGTTKPFIEEAVLQVSNWGFSLADLQVRKKCQTKGILLWLRSMYSQAECELAGFLGPMHIWQVWTHLPS